MDDMRHNVRWYVYSCDFCGEKEGYPSQYFIYSRKVLCCLQVKSTQIDRTGVSAGCSHIILS